MWTDSGARPLPEPLVTYSTPPTPRPSPSWRKAAEDADAAIAAARRAFDQGQGEWPRTPVAERAALLRRVADLLQRDREELALLESRDAGKTSGGRPRRRRLRDRRLPVLRRPRRQRERRPGRRRRLTGHPQRGRPRTRRRLRPHHPLELPPPPGQLEDRPGARRGQHLRRQAERDHPALHRGPRPAARGGRPPGRCRQHRHRPRRPRRRPLRRAPRRRPGLLHRRPRQRHEGDARRRRLRQEGRPRTRRQEPERGLRGRLRHGRGFDTAVDQALNAAFIHSGQVCSAAPGSSSRSPCGSGSRPNWPAAPSGSASAAAPTRTPSAALLVSAAQLAPHRGLRRLRPRRRRRPARGRRTPHRTRAARRLVLPAHRPRPLPPPHAGGPRGGLRPGPHRRDVPYRGRGGRPRQRHRVRPGRSRLVRRRGPRPARRRPAPPRHRLDQRLPPLPAAGGVGGFGKSGVGRERCWARRLAEYRESKHDYAEPRARCAGSRADQPPPATGRALPPARPAAHRPAHRTRTRNTRREQHPDHTPQLSDYVIVGETARGSVIAHRLTAEPDVTVTPSSRAAPTTGTGPTSSPTPPKRLGLLGGGASACGYTVEQPRGSSHIGTAAPGGPRRLLLTTTRSYPSERAPDPDAGTSGPRRRRRLAAAAMDPYYDRLLNHIVPVDERGPERHRPRLRRRRASRARRAARRGLQQEAVPRGRRLLRPGLPPGGQQALLRLRGLLCTR